MNSVFATWILTSASFFLFASSSAANPAAVDRSVRVRVLQNQSVATIRGYGLLFELEAIDPTQSVLPTKAEYRIIKAAQGWDIFDSQARKISHSGDVLKLKGTEILINGAYVTDAVTFVKDTSTTMDVILSMPIEQYLLGVLPSEMPIHWPLEALKAQATASRTYAMAAREKQAGEHHHLESTVNDQVFSWAGYKKLPLHLQEKVEQAVQQTAGMYLVNKKKQPYWSYFHSHCGGQTEEPRQVWGAGSYNGTVKDAACAVDAKGLWSTVFTEAEIFAILRRKQVASEFVAQQAIELESVQMGSNESSSLLQRMDYVQFVFKDKNGNGVTENIAGQDLRRLFGYGKIKSTLLKLSYENKVLKISGQGYGHGAGMCQAGARIMALSGRNYRDILQRYYPNSAMSVPNLITENIGSVEPKL